ncbi:MAG: hypothetical protein IT330_18790, partial [Anaerolineae bacterium]|nr:hypothetical protein [Anaerolineae bacterium]
SVYSPNWQRYTAGQMLGSGTPGALLVELTRTWVGLGNGVSWRDAATWGHFDIAGNGSAVSALARDGAGLLWIGTAGNGLYAHNGTNITTHQATADGLPHNDVRALLVDQAGRLWAATAGGLALRGNGYWIGFTTATSPLTSNDLRTLTQDATGRIWIGTAANGIHVYDPNGSGNVWSAQTTANGLPSNNIRGLATDPTGAIWAATAAGVGRWEPTTGVWTVYNQAGGALPSNDAISIASDPVGRIWVGTARGLAHLEAGAWRQFHVTGTMLGSDRVRVVASDGIRLWTAAAGIVAVRGVLTGPIGNFPPIINSFIPTQGAPLDTITINGNYFDDRGPSYNEVRFCCLNGQSGTPAPLATVLSATATTLIVKVPLLANTGKLRVTSHQLNGQSATDFRVAPKINSISPTCLGMGEVLKIHGSGFFGQQFSYAQVQLGNGPWRTADFQDPTLIQQYVRPGDTAGPVRVRLSNGLSATSPQNVSISTPQVAATAIQQAIQGLPMIWGKRTLVQVSLRSAGASCNSRITGGQLDWKLKNGTTRPGSYGIITSDSGLVVTPNAPAISVDSTVNFVAEFNSNRSQWSENFALSQFNGVRITLKNGIVQILSLDIPASAFNYVDTAGRREFVSMQIGIASATTQDASATRLTTFWENALESMADVARVYPMQDTHWTQWMGYTSIYFTRSSANLRDDSDDYEEIRDDVDDYIEPSGIRQAMALITELLYGGGPSGKATLGHPTSVAFNFDGSMAPIFLQEGIHALDWVDPDAANHDSGNEYHSRYDEAERTDVCTMSLTFRQALLDQMGFVPRVVRLRYEEDPKQFSLAGCDPANQPRSAMSYAPNWDNNSTFLEPLDYLYTLFSICLSFGSGGIGSACPGFSIPLNSDVIYNQVVRYLAAHRPAASALPADVTQTLRIGGSIDTSDRVTVTLSYLAGTDGELTPEVPGGDYHLQLRSATSALLWDHPFEISFVGTHSHENTHPLSRTRFNLLVPFPDGTATAEIRRDGQVIWSDTVSSNAPTVAFTGPNGGTFSAAGNVPVAWTAADIDGDALQFALEYSADNGQNWILIAPALTGNAFNWQPGFVPPSATARLRLRASDGFLTGTATSAPFTLNAQPPEAYIVTPDDGQTFLEGSTIALGGTARTANGLDEGTFQWKRGNLVIGSGQGISYTLGAIGTYVFTLQVTANSLTASDSVTVTVVPDYDKDGMPNAWELSYKLNPLDSTDIVGNPDSDGLENLDEYKMGTNPRQADTDGDGANDGSEVAAGSDPLKADHKPATGPVLSVGANEIGFTVEGGITPAPKEVWVTNTGAGSLAWTATDDAAWLQVSPGQGDAPEKLTLSVASVQGLAYGTHTGQVTVTAAGATGSPHVITVELHIVAGQGYRLYMPGAKVQSGQ